MHCTNEPNVSIPQLANLLIERSQNANWVVVFKALITVHHMLCYGNEVRNDKIEIQIDIEGKIGFVKYRVSIVSMSPSILLKTSRLPRFEKFYEGLRKGVLRGSTPFLMRYNFWLIAFTKFKIFSKFLSSS